ncbi:MAG: hypothetical protein DRJ35_03925 [Thermoprotei archaeon]|nr:MAG: hypothetical protein DRJ35_03925 [Thermoprotei archaeon]
MFSIGYSRASKGSNGFSFGKIILIAIIAVVAIGALSILLLGTNTQISFKALLEKNPDHIVVYNVTMESMGYQQYMKIVYAKKGENIKMMLSGSTGEAMLLILGDKAYSCASMGDTWQCNEVSKENIVQKDMKYVAQEMQNITYAGEKHVAGYASKCWNGTVSKQGVTSRVQLCITNDGVATLIYSEQVYNGELVGRVKIEAVEINYNVPDEEFQLPG